MRTLRMTSVESDSPESTSSFLSSFCKQDHTGSLDDEFYFETDFLALKGNPDYLKLMKTLAILEVQRTKVCQNIDKLEELRLRALEDPFAVKKEILNSNAPYLYRCNIEEVPEIDWSKYRTFNGKNPLLTRRMAKLKQTSEPGSSVEKRDNHIKVRGRVYNEEKPQTFNQLWTVEEQLRLEALLIEYPPERVENRRWKKIADALGNRTTQQVCSRMQKYYKKLHKAGLAVPGSSKRTQSQKPRHMHRRHRDLLRKPTTFFPAAAMAELAEIDSDSSSSSDSADLSHWNQILSIIKHDKNNATTRHQVQHYGYNCQRCMESPIVGIRWECTLCPTVSMCSDCMVALLDDPSPPTHPLTHNFKPKNVFINPRYSSAEFATNNYLDPNFVT